MQKNTYIKEFLKKNTPDSNTFVTDLGANNKKNSLTVS
jgi:hypothetical protein